MIAKPKEWQHNIDAFVVSAIHASVYGTTLESDSPVIVRAHAYMARLVESSSPGFSLVELFPVLAMVPAWLAAWKKEALQWHENTTRYFEQLLMNVEKETLIKAEGRTFAADMLEKGGKYGLARKEVAWLAGSALGVGAETTAVALYNFVLAMVLHPNIMHKAQAELDEVVGRGRPPSFDDKESLPYTCAVIKETLRWRTVAPLAAMCRITEGDSYGGYLIPKGTAVIANIWYGCSRLSIVLRASWGKPMTVLQLRHRNMHRDPQTYPDFDNFRPERFLHNEDGADATYPTTQKLEHFTFGFGRRSCSGQHLANETLFISISMMLWALDLTPAIDGQGKVILPSAN